jgi:hypothetical protein
VNLQDFNLLASRFGQALAPATTSASDDDSIAAEEAEDADAVKDLLR